MSISRKASKDQIILYAYPLSLSATFCSRGTAAVKNIKIVGSHHPISQKVDLHLATGYKYKNMIVIN